MINKLDYILDRITMYRVVLYSLLLLLFYAIILSIFVLSFTPIQIIISFGIIFVSSLVSNYVFAKIFSVPSNIESVYITALILTLICIPFRSPSDIPLLIFAGIFAMASKYIFTVNNTHIFNPAGFGMVFSSLMLGNSAGWWIGSWYFAPLVVVLGMCIVRKLRYTRMVLSFFLVSILVTLLLLLMKSANVALSLQNSMMNSFVLFLGFFMLTDPLTLPSKRNMQIVYGGLVGLLSVPQFQIASLYFAPELALCIGNVFAYIVNPKYTIILRLKEKMKIAPDIYDFIFDKNKKISFVPGQYMEWTLAHSRIDSRGMRRYFTLASSPTENDIRIGVKYYQNASSYKQQLFNLKEGETIVASQLSGDFVLPKNSDKKLVFIAGGIGITPFRSMVKYLVDRNEKRDIVLLYLNKRENEIVYKDIFEAGADNGVRSIYLLTGVDYKCIKNTLYQGRVTKEKIELLIPDFRERIFYISGPHLMVTECEKILRELSVKKEKIKVDYFPGLV